MKLFKITYQVEGEIAVTFIRGNSIEDAISAFRDVYVCDGEILSVVLKIK